MNEHIYEKTVDCPICKNTFNTYAVKVNSPRMLSKDSDFFINYGVINPYLYDVWICNRCGYTSMKADFNKIKSYHKEIVLLNITPKWSQRKYPENPTVNQAIEKYKLALINSMTLERPQSSNGMICLKIAWMYRLLKDSKNELNYLDKALKSLQEAFFKEDFPMYGMQRDSMTYLIGELNRRLNKFDEALKWYSKTISTIGATYKIKELARDGRDKIKDCTKEKENES